jgi:hypothetical protein
MRPMACGDLRSRSTLIVAAVVLCGGDKSGGSQRHFYQGLIAKADLRFDAHLERLKAKSQGRNS